MLGQIITFISCLFCTLPFFIIAHYDKEGTEPINFWSGDTTLKNKVKEVSAYNLEMSKVYRYYAGVIFLTGIICFLNLVAALILIFLDLSVGLFFVYRQYKRILHKYS